MPPGCSTIGAADSRRRIRAALCYDQASARNSREHNDSNVLTLGARLLTRTQAEDVLRTWIATPFAGGRHQARVQKIMDIEQRYNVAVKALRTIAGFGHVEGCTSSAPVHECGCYDADEREIATEALARLGEE